MAATHVNTLLAWLANPFTKQTPKLEVRKTHLVEVLVSCFLFSAPASATTYYVKTSGSDSSGTGTSAKPWRNPQKCVNADSPLVAGDTCLVGPGVYADSDNNGITVYATGTTAPQGTASKPITLKSEVPLGAVIKVRADFEGHQSGFYIGRDFYVIEGFDIDGSGSAKPNTSGTNSGIAVWGRGVVVRRNKIHDIGRTTCSNSVNGITGIYAARAGLVAEFNEFYKIGRLRGVTGFNENGCTLTPGNQGGSSHDHPIYAGSATDMVVKRNVIWDSQRGYAIHVYKSGGTSHTNVVIDHNTIHGEGDIGVGPHAQLLLANTISGAVVRNNLLAAPRFAPLSDYEAAFSNISVKGNLTDSTDVDWWAHGGIPAGVDMSAPGRSRTSPGFSAAQSNDFTLSPSSAARNAGVTTGAPFSGRGEDVGAFEMFGVTAASINGRSLTVTTDVAFPPLQPMSGAKGWSVSCTGAQCGTPTVSSVTVLPGRGNVLRLTIAGISGTSCMPEQVWTFNFSPGNGGAVKDSVNIGSRLNQPMHSVSNAPATNDCGKSLPTPEAPGQFVVR